MKNQNSSDPTSVGNPYFIPVTNYLVNLSFRRNLKGFYYVRTAIIILLMKRGSTVPMMELYRQIAFHHDALDNSVERAIRVSVTDAHNKSEKMIEKFDCDNLSNSLFIHTATDELRTALASK